MSPPPPPPPPPPRPLHQYRLPQRLGGTRPFTVTPPPIRIGPGREMEGGTERERGQEYRGRRERRGGGETEDVVVLVLIVVDKEAVQR